MIDIWGEGANTKLGLGGIRKILTDIDGTIGLYAAAAARSWGLVYPARFMRCDAQSKVNESTCSTVDADSVPYRSSFPTALFVSKTLDYRTSCPLTPSTDSVSPAPS